MNKLLSAGLLLAALFLTGCDKPNPVSLENPAVQNEDAAVIEVLSSDPGVNNAPYSFDTTAYFRPDQSALRADAAMFIAKNKIIAPSGTLNTGLAEFYYFDKTKPIVNPMGHVIAYRTKPIDFFRVGLYQGREMMHRMRYRNQGGVTDSLIGPKYRIFGAENAGYPNDFLPDYSRSINIYIKPDMRPTVQFSIDPVQEVTGVVHRLSSGGQEVVKVEWNASGSGIIEIVIGARLITTDEGIALFRIRTADDGSYIIPRNLLQAIPAGRFKSPSLTLIRRSENVKSFEGSQLLIVTISNCSIRMGN